MKALFLIPLLVCACGSSTNNSVGTEQQSGACQPNPSTLTGSAATGASCKSASDCQPACCHCTRGTSGDTFWASECKSGSCATSATACADAQTSTLCP